MLRALELPREWLPTVFESPEVKGAGDQAAGALGVGVVAPGTLSIVLGTSGVVSAEADAARRSRRTRRVHGAHAPPRSRRARARSPRRRCLRAARSLELLRAVGVEAHLARVSGGGARSELWLKIVASVLGTPLERTIA